MLQLAERIEHTMIKEKHKSRDDLSKKCYKGNQKVSKRYLCEKKVSKGYQKGIGKGNKKTIL